MYESQTERERYRICRKEFAELVECAKRSLGDDAAISHKTQKFCDKWGFGYWEVREMVWKQTEEDRRKAKQEKEQAIEILKQEATAITLKQYNIQRIPHCGDPKCDGVCQDMDCYGQDPAGPMEMQRKNWKSSPPAMPPDRLLDKPEPKENLTITLILGAVRVAQWGFVGYFIVRLIWLGYT